MKQMDKPNKDELQRRYDGLESTAMIMAAQGLTIPKEVSDELLLVRSQLEQFAAAVEIKEWTSWLGYTLEGFTILEKLSSGTYCHVFRAVNEQTKETCVFKIAKSEQPVHLNTDSFSKQAVSLCDEICSSLDITANLAIESECRRLQSDMSGSFVPVLSSGHSHGLFYYRMPFLTGQSLKELIPLTDMPFMQYVIEIFARLCQILERLEGRHYHGNLQPDNIFISKTDIVLLSPGAFDLSTNTGTRFMLCTPAYYPFFEANDLFSLGCIFWEAILKVHPLAVKDKPERLSQFADDLREMLEYRKSLNHAPLWQFLKIVPPKDQRSDLSDKAELFMMKTLKLAYQSDGLITGCPGFRNASEFAIELKAVENHGILREAN